MEGYILKLDDERAVLAAAGGKGASLARLAAAGLPVPDGFHITTNAYKRFVEENALQVEIMRSLEGLAYNDPDSLEQAAAAIQALFMEGQMPGDLAADIRRAYRVLDGGDAAVAVRSSATAEDLPELSFAGQQESYLNIYGEDRLLQAVQRCWASLWTARAIGYRLRNHIAADEVSLAVVVQLLVPADAAGVLFTANPLNNRRDQMVINAAWGLGEAVVGGQVTPDTLTIGKKSRQVVERRIARKQLMTVRHAQGSTTEEPVSAEMQTGAVLDDQQVADLAALAGRCEQLFGMPLDIEWALGGNAFSILQARPITTLGVPEYAVPTEWPLPRAKASYMRGSIVDYMADPLTPLFASMGLEIYNREFRQLVADLFHIEKGFNPEFVTINDYAYSTFDYTIGGLLALIVRMVIIMPGLLRTAGERWQNQAVPQYRAVVEQWQEKKVEDLVPRELLQGAAAIFRQTAIYLTHIQSGSLGAAMFSEAVFTLVYDRLIKRKGDPPASIFLLGFDSLPILAEKSLYDLAQSIKSTSGLADILSTVEAEEILSLLKEGLVPEGVTDGEWQAWSSRFSAYLAEYGHNIYDLDFARRLPQDEPTPVLNILKLYLQGKGQNPYDRQREAVASRWQATEAIREKTGRLRRGLFDKLLKFAQKNVALREDSIACIGLGYPCIRALLLELGRRLTVHKVVDESADIFWLDYDEAKWYAAALEGGETPLAMHGEIQARKALWQAEKKATPPPMLPVKGKVLGMDGESMASARVDDGSSDCIKGVAASPGRTRAPACVLHGPEEFGKMKQGDVLVAATTTPAWTPLFALASAVVTDVGGPLSHGSIVAREYGIPAVLGTGSATRRIRDGQFITVDGGEGMVVLETGDARG